MDSDEDENENEEDDDDDFKVKKKKKTKSPKQTKKPGKRGAKKQNNDSNIDLLGLSQDDDEVAETGGETATGEQGETKKKESIQRKN